MTVVTVLIDTLVPTGYIRYAHQMVRKSHPTLLSSALTPPHICLGCFVFSAFAPALMLKVRDRPPWNRPEFLT